MIGNKYLKSKKKAECFTFFTFDKLISIKKLLSLLRFKILKDFIY